MFPWLNKIASLYQKYRFRKLCFEYRPTVGVFSGSAVSGKVGLAVDLDGLADDLVNAEQANLIDPNCSGVLTQTICLPMDCRTVGDRFVRTEVLPPGGDIKTYDYGKLFMFRYGTFDTTQIGELHVNYEIELIGQVLENSNSVANHFVVSAHNTGTALAVTGALVKAPLGTYILEGFSTANVGGDFTLPPGIYRLTVWSYIIASGGTLSVSTNAVTIDGVAILGCPVDNRSHAAGATAEDSLSIEWVFRLTTESTLAYWRSATVSAGTASCADAMTLQVIEA